MMKILSYISLFFIAFQISFAQDLTISSFKQLETDLDARVRHPVKDQNGKLCALIKVVNPNDGFTFDTGTLQIIKTQHEVGETWVYVQSGVKKITIKHPVLGVLRDFIFSIPINEASTYEMILLSGKVQTTIQKQNINQFFTLKVYPANSIVYIDNNPQTVSKEGEVSVLLKYGLHSYRVEAPNYSYEEGTVVIGKEKQTKTITLKSTLAELMVSTETPDAQIFINEKPKGVTDWKGSLPAGNYIIEATKEGFKSYSETISLEKNEKKNIIIPDLEPIFGAVAINYTPLDSKVFIDGEEIGKSPLVIEEVIVGKHLVKIEKAGYVSEERSVLIEENEQLIVEGSLSSNSTQKKSSDIYAYAVLHSDGSKKVGENNKYKLTRFEKIKRGIFYAGVGYQIEGYPKLDIKLGGYLKAINLELTVNTLQSATAFWQTLSSDSAETQPEFGEDYYSNSLCFQIKVGYGFCVNKNFLITPQIGYSLCNYYGSKEKNAYYRITNSAQAVTITAKTEYSPFNHLSLYICPQYSLRTKDFTIEGFTYNSPVLKQTNNGFSISVGLSLYY